jgi:hypothetical protein
LPILGGTSVWTPVLIGLLAQEVVAGALPPLELRLFGRAMDRAGAMLDWCRRELPALGDRRLKIGLFEDLDTALSDARVIVCQVRPGGQQARHRAEELALAEGLPGDEGLGPSGLASFLAGRALMDRIADAWAARAPSAAFLQLTSPLSLTVARAWRRTGRRMIGVCELPRTTFAAVRAAAAEKGIDVRGCAHFGLNHMAWLHAFTDAAGADVTDEVLAGLDIGDFSRLPASVVRRQRALPVRYLDVFHDPRTVRDQQARRSQTRGAELHDLTDALGSAYMEQKGVKALLARRHMPWYQFGVLPAISSILADHISREVFTIAGIDENALGIERPFEVGPGMLRPVNQPALPPGPRLLFAALARYEEAVVALPERPTGDELASALKMLPGIDEPDRAERLAARVLGAIDGPGGA